MDSRPPITPASTATETAPATVAKLDSDRLCQSCLHQLSGQLVYRDPRLGILYVRCPECGTNSAVTEFPVSGRWMRRFGAFLIAIMLMVGLALLAADVAGTSASVYEGGWEFGRSFTAQLTEVGKMLPAVGANTQNNDWWAPSALVSDGATLGAIGADPALRNAAWGNWEGIFIPAGIAGTVSGVVWSVVLLHRRASRAWMWLLVPHLLGTGIALFAYWVTVAVPGRSPAGFTIGYSDLAFREYGLTGLLAAAAAMLPMRVGVFFIARPIMKGMAAVVLPGKLRGAVADAWADPVPPIHSA